MLIMSHYGDIDTAEFSSFPSHHLTTGLRPTGFYGAFFMSNTTDIELGSIDSDKVVAVEIKHDDKLKEEDIAFFQVCCV